MKKNIIKFTWDDFKRQAALRLSDVDYNRWCFRGQPNEKVKLRTTFHRMAEKYGCLGCTSDHITGMGFETYFGEVIGEAHRCVSSVLDREIKLDDDKQLISFLALLQHHGFPTPLLDWTLSPYIAAYFAFRDINSASPECKHVAVYALDTAMINSAWPEMQDVDIKQDAVEYVRMVNPVAISNPRVIPQQSVCALTNIDNLDDWIWKHKEAYTEPPLLKILLDVSEKPTVMRELNLMGINSMTMFPTIDGICRFLKETICPPKEICKIRHSRASHIGKRVKRKSVI